MLKQRRHHLPITSQDAHPIWMCLWQLSKQFGHACRYPADTASPKELGIGSVIKEPVRLLQSVEISSHGQRSAIQVLDIACRSIRLHLNGRDHVHVVDPVTRFSREDRKSTRLNSSHGYIS